MQTSPARQQPIPIEEPIELSIVMPCLNEAETLAVCLIKAGDFLAQNGISGEIVVADNGSLDGSQQIAEQYGARLVHVRDKGYGSALMGGIAAAKGRYIIMGDADDSYDFAKLGPFLDKLRDGYELVMGNRFKGGIARGAMPALHRYLGNPLLTGIGRLFFGSPIGDFHCGLRGLRKASVDSLNLRSTGMEFASEMVVKATLYGLRMTEIPTTLAPDGRSRPPHLRSWRDGWRHLRFLLIYSPRWLFLLPGLALIAVGLLMLAVLLSGPKVVFGISFDVQTMLYSAFFVIVGFQSVCFYVCSRMFAVNNGLLPRRESTHRLLESITLEKGILLGVLFFLSGLSGTIAALMQWGEVSFGQLDSDYTMRLIVPSILSSVIGVQTIFSCFFISLLGFQTRDRRGGL